MKLADQLVQIAKEFGLEVGPGPHTLNRTRAGYWQRSAGAWSWWLADAEGREVIGSCSPATDVVRAYKDKRLTFFSSGHGTEFFVESSP